MDEDSAVRFQAKCKQVQVADKTGQLFKNVSSDVQHSVLGIVSEGIVIPPVFQTTLTR